MCKTLVLSPVSGGDSDYTGSVCSPRSTASYEMEDDYIQRGVTNSQTEDIFTKMGMANSQTKDDFSQRLGKLNAGRRRKRGRERERERERERVRERE